MIRSARRGYICIAAMLILSLPIFFLPAFAPDEIWFLHDATTMVRSGGGFWNQLPHLGYGAGFWYGYEQLIRLFGDGITTLYVLRGIMFLLLGSLPFLLWRTGRESEYRWHALILWWALPLAWWNGKLDSPEIPVWWLCVCAYLFISEKRGAVGWFLFGLAIGLKLTCLPVGILLLFVAFSISRQESARAMRNTTFVPLSAALGLIATNPVLLHKPAAFVSSVAEAATPFSVTPAALIRLLVWPFWEWDGIPSGGVFVHGIVLPAALLLTVAFAAEVRRRSPAAIASAGVMLMWLAGLILNLRMRFLVWYLFPLIVLTPFLLMRLTMASRWLVTLAVACQILLGFPLIYAQYRSKIQNFQELAGYKNTRDQIRPVLTRWKPDTVADDSAIGRLQPESLPGVAYLPEMASELVILEGPRYWLGSSNSRRLAIAVDKRLIGLNARYDVPANSANARWLGNWQLIDTTETPSAFLYLFVLPPQSPYKANPSLIFPELSPVLTAMHYE